MVTLRVFIKNDENSYFHHLSITFNVWWFQVLNDFNKIKIYVRKFILLLNYKCYVKGLKYFIAGSDIYYFSIFRLNTPWFIDDICSSIYSKV